MDVHLDAPHRLAVGLLAVSLALTLALSAPPSTTAAPGTPAATAAPAAATAPAPVRGPWVSGAAEAGSTLTAEAGAWEPADVAFTFQWLADGRRIRGAAGRSYTIPAFDSGTRYTVRVTGTSGGLSTTARAKPTRATVAIPGTAPFGNRLMPAVVGRPVVGARLEADPGEWSSPPTRYRFQWLADGAPIAGATGRVFVATEAELGRRLAVEVVAVSDDGSMRRTADPTAPVAAAPSPGNPPEDEPAVAVSSGPRLSAAPLVGRRLRVETGSTEPATATASVQWLLDGVAVAGADTGSYTPASTEVGRSLAARVTYRHPSRRPTTRTTAAAVVRSPATVRARAATAAPGRARLVVQVTAPGVRPVTGRVLVRRRDGARLAGARLREGRAVVVVRGLRPGRHWLRVVHPGGSLVTRDRQVVRVVVRR